MDIRDKVRIVRESLGLSKMALSISLKSSPGYVGLIESGKRIPSEAFIQLLQNQYAVSKEWWDTGKGQIFNTLPSAGAFAMVKVYNRICCGDGIEPGGREEIGVVPVPVKYDKPHIIMVRAQGHSMEPTIKEGGYVGIDTSDRDVVSGEMYAVCSQLEGAVVKRLVVKGDCLELVSENKVFESVEVKDVPSYFVIGRVRLVVNEY